MIQAIIGNITAGSLFAVLQSIGMGGAIPTAASAVAAILGARVGARVAAVRGKIHRLFLFVLYVLKKKLKCLK
jgi:hypothetical protein